MSIPVPFSNWSLKIQRPFISFVEAADIIVPGLTGTYSRRAYTQWLKVYTDRRSRSRPWIWMDDAASIDRYSLRTR